MTTISATAPRRSNWRETLNRPSVALAVAIIYLATSILLLFALNRNSLWFYTFSLLATPIFLMSPIVVASLNIQRRIKIVLFVIMFVVIMPIMGIKNTPLLELAIQISIFAGLALGLNIVVGFAGLLDLGYMAFFAVGAYLWGMATSPSETIFTTNGWTVSNWVSNPDLSPLAAGFVAFVQSGAFFFVMFLGIIAAALVGILLGLPVLRLRGDYLAIVTLGFGEVIRILARNLDAPINYTNGTQGLRNIGAPPLPGFYISFTRSIASALGIQVDNPDAIAKQMLFYTIGLIVLLLIILVCFRLKDSVIGRAWTAIREDEIAAIAMGIPLVRMKLLAFASGAAFAGAIGVLYASKQTFIDPTSFEVIQSITILAMVIVGGMGNVKGVILGAMIITIIELHTLPNLSLQFNALRNAGQINIPTQLDPSKYQPLVFGLVLVIMMLFRPAGLLPEKSRKLELQERDDDPLENPTEEPLSDAVLIDTSVPQE